MDIPVKVNYEELRTLGFAAIGAVYIAVGTVLDHAAHIIEIDNTTDENLFISYDGVTDHRFIYARTGKVIDYATNRTSNSRWVVPAGRRIYVKQETGAPTLGNVYISVAYSGE